MSTFEADLSRELRALPTGAPAALRERVRALGEPEPRRVLPTIPWRRATVVLVPACLAVVLAAAVVHGLLVSRGGRRSSTGSFTTARAAANSHGQAAGAPGSRTRTLAPGTDQRLTPFEQSGAVPAPNPSRHQDYQADLRVRVSDLDALGRRTADAMRITRDLGGYVASVSQDSYSGAPGEADLVLRVPVAHVEDAMIRLAALGTVLEQHVSIVDLENTVQQQRARIRALEVQIARITAALRQSLPADVRLRLQFQLDDARRNLATATGASKATLRAAALSRISLSLTTQHAVAPAKHHRSRVGAAVSGAVDFLAGAGAIALAALIVLLPVALVVLLVAWGVRVGRRRAATRLLEAS